MFILTVISIPLIFIILFIIFLKLKLVLQESYCRSKQCLVGKTALVVGANEGIGYQMVLGLASRGCSITVADCYISNSIKDSIYEQTNNGNVTFQYVDLASFASVRSFAEEFTSKVPKLDILINNAGVARAQSVKSKDGLEVTMQVNYYSAFLLTHLLLDVLKKSPFGARIIFTSSLFAYIHFLTARQVTKNCIDTGSGCLSYSISKFCQIAASDILAKKLKKYGITSNCFHPYAAKTNLFKESFLGANWREAVLFTFFRFAQLLYQKNADESAQTGIYLACAAEMKDVTGGFFGSMQQAWKPLRANDKVLCEAIWNCTERVVGLQPEEKIL